MDEQDHGIFAGGIEIRWLDDEALDLSIFRAGDPEVFERSELIGSEEIVVEMSERDDRAARGHGFADFGGTVAALTSEDDRFAIGGELHVIERVVAADGETIAPAVDSDVANGLGSAIDHGIEEAARIGRPCEAVDGAIDGVGGDSEFPAGTFEDEETPAVRFVSGARLRTVRKIFAVG